MGDSFSGDSFRGDSFNGDGFRVDSSDTGGTILVATVLGGQF